ncbi:MAG: Rab family GTPase [Planctomycetota bacterium]
MKEQKICMLGAFAVGKTSLVRRFVEGMFSEEYLTTIGVKIDQKQVSCPRGELLMILWDVAGEDRFHTITDTYLRGSAAYLLVADGGRPQTIEQALQIDQRAQKLLGGVPRLLLLNKADLREEWPSDDGVALARAAELGMLVLPSSAKTGVGVEEAFVQLADQLL